jgi:hypothetical protein
LCVTRLRSIAPCLIRLGLIRLSIIVARPVRLAGKEALDVGPGQRGGVKVDGHVILRDEVTPDSLVAARVAGLVAARVQLVTPSRPGCVP